MSVFYPKANFNRVTEINKKVLDEFSIKGLIVDIDNTLTAQDSQDIGTDIKDWVENTVEHTPIVLVSNNFRDRVEPFADMLGLGFVHTALKPFPFWGIHSAIRKLGISKKNVAIVGDQIFTDVLGGNLAQIVTFRVEPLSLKENKAVGFKRKLEKRIVEDYKKKRGAEQ